MSEFGGLIMEVSKLVFYAQSWKYMNNPGCIKSVSLQHVVAGHCTVKKKRPKLNLLKILLFFQHECCGVLF